MSMSYKTRSDIKENVVIDSGTEDELSAPSKRNSAAGQASPAGLDPTPYANLRHLAGLIRNPSTPRRRASSVGAITPRGNAVGTLSAKSRTPGARRPLQASLTTRSNPATPHAIRVSKQRRATPGRDRRKSSRMQRETPRDALRNLSKILALTSQPYPLPSRPEQIEPRLTGSNSIEDGPELQRPSFSIAMEDRADEDDSFQLAPPRLSMPLEEEEQTGRSIEIGRRALDDRPPGRLSRGSFGTVRGSDRFDDLSALGLSDVSQPPFEDSVLQDAPDVDEEDPEVLGRKSSLGGETEDLQRAMYKDYDRRESHLSEIQQARELEGGVHSPFILSIPELQSRRSSAVATCPDEQQLGGFDEEPEQSVLNIRLSNPNATTKTERRAPRPMKKSRDGFPYPSFPVGITKRIASIFAGSLGNKSTIIDKEILEAITEATNQYFEQLSNDLGAFANHAGRKKIDESDVIAVMRRQRQVSATTTAFSLAKKYLPGELLQGIRMPTAKVGRVKRRRPLKIVDGNGEEGGE